MTTLLMTRSNVSSGKSSVFAFITRKSQLMPCSAAFSFATLTISGLMSMPVTSCPSLAKLIVKNPGPVPMSSILSLALSGAFSRDFRTQASLASRSSSSLFTPSL